MNTILTPSHASHTLSYLTRVEDITRGRGMNQPRDDRGSAMLSCNVYNPGEHAVNSVSHSHRHPLISAHVHPSKNK